MVSNIGLDGGANNHVSKDDPMYKQLALRPRYDLNDIICGDIAVNHKFEKNFYKEYEMVAHLCVRFVQ